MKEPIYSDVFFINVYNLLTCTNVDLRILAQMWSADKLSKSQDGTLSSDHIIYSVLWSVLELFYLQIDTEMKTAESTMDV